MSLETTSPFSWLCCTCRKFLQTNPERNIKAWELASLNIFRKYSGPIDIWLSVLSSKRHPSKAIIVNEQPWKSYGAMAQHLSQWVWYVSFPKYDHMFSSLTIMIARHDNNWNTNLSFVLKMKVFCCCCDCAGSGSFSFHFQAIHTQIHLIGSTLNQLTLDGCRIHTALVEAKKGEIVLNKRCSL